MTASDLVEYVGQVLGLKVEGLLRVEVEILDARWNFGKLEFLITPTHGSGRKWVDAMRTDWPG